MTVVDSSVGIDFLDGRNAPHVATLHAMLGRDEIILGDLMLCEVLQALDTENDAERVESLLRRFDIVPMTGENRQPLLHNDSDFRPMAGYLGRIEVLARPR